MEKHLKDNMALAEQLKRRPRQEEKEEEEEVNLIKKRKMVEDVVVITATYKDDTVRFELRPWSSSPGPMKMLLYEVGRGFDLGVGCFKLKYMDPEEHHLIRLACDDDVHLCLRTFIPTPAKSHHIHLFVQKII